MPSCSCGDKCNGKSLPLYPKKHKCPGCKGPMHSICGIIDDKQPVNQMNWCISCYEKKKKERNTSRFHLVLVKSLKSWLAKKLR